MLSNYLNVCIHRVLVIILTFGLISMAKGNFIVNVNNILSPLIEYLLYCQKMVDGMPF